ncbi:hypothetical protein [Aquisalinus luteolus]|uniref:ASCH domain-containing protein n=1 Tax=Aquisalinus luteolus TaxID=1566827 RepID=A0A8J3A4U6_9PROT|nr:hypothetical protein [Aquisalinus luteolus]GGH99957.1 hypothetical protein GCM10011355_27120 [Aquisalinus luteolus]
MTNDLPRIALAVRQPWAWAIIHGGKNIENRNKHAINLGGMKPGRIAILASKGMQRREYEHARDFMQSIGVQCPRPDELVRGGVIGSVTVTDIINESDSPWFFGPWGLVLSDPEPAALPLPASGQLGYFKWETDLDLDFEDPSRWMKAWPDGHRPHREGPVQGPPAPASMPLFGK